MVKNMKSSPILATLVLAALGMMTLSSCRYDMQDQPKYKPFRGSELFTDSLSSRSLVEGVVARGYLREDKELYTGKGSMTSSSVDSTGKIVAGGSEVTAFPFPITREILDRGQERFGIYCAPCHSAL